MRKYKATNIHMQASYIKKHNKRERDDINVIHEEEKYDKAWIRIPAERLTDDEE
ncbi:hypothetical protein O9993_13730 [Vibrio lentus]|nr:hypothetical protein [Vibrio lentus]